MAKPVTVVAAPAAKKSAISAFLAASRAHVANLEAVAQQINREAAAISQNATGPLTDAQITQIDALEEAENTVRALIARYSAIENMKLNTSKAVKDLAKRIRAANSGVTAELKKLDKIATTIKSINAVIDTLAAVLKAATAVATLFP